MMMRPDLDHGYVSEPEPALGDRTITYTRGKGLGGSSILNFGVYLYGSGEDYNRWGEMVGDESWNWESVRRSFAEIETYDFSGISGTSGYEKLASPAHGVHGSRGLLKVGLPPVLEKGVVPQMEALREAGETINLDPNSGNPLGVSVFPYSYSKEGRSTSAIAFLRDTPENLTVWTDATVTKLVFEGDRVVGVRTADGREGESVLTCHESILMLLATSTKEVIICSGSIDTPRLLLLNGIGPRDELEALGIHVKKDLPGVGKHLQDHVLTFMGLEVDGNINDRYGFESNETLSAEASALWEQDQSGAFALQQSCLWGGFLKHAELESWPEYQNLEQEMREFLSRDAVPTYEFISNGLLWPPGSKIEEGNSYMTPIAFLMNPQSEGSVTLRSADANDKPVVNLNFLTHPYDKRVMRETVRTVWQKIVENPKIKGDIRRTLCGPKSLSDGDVDEFVRDNASTVWHANGTVMMGKTDDGKACVDSRFRVFGVEGLRVADLSVCPLTTSNHTQATAYLVGQKAADKLVQEYGLEGELKRHDTAMGTCTP
jgi:choline dehydrogenase-like flavoprotein